MSLRLLLCIDLRTAELDACDGFGAPGDWGDGIVLSLSGTPLALMQLTHDTPYGLEALARAVDIATQHGSYAMSSNIR